MARNKRFVNHNAYLWQHESETEGAGWRDKIEEVEYKVSKKNVNENLHSLTHCPRLHSRASRVLLDPWFIQKFGTCQKKTRHKTFRIQTQNTNLGPRINQNEENL